MKSSKKTNPRRKPVTLADINRAKNKAMDFALEHALLMILYNLVYRHDAPKEDIQQLAKEVNATAELIRDGYITWADIRHTLIEEYEIELDLH